MRFPVAVQLPTLGDRLIRIIFKSTFPFQKTARQTDHCFPRYMQNSGLCTRHCQSATHLCPVVVNSCSIHTGCNNCWFGLGLFASCDVLKALSNGTICMHPPLANAMKLLKLYTVYQALHTKWVIAYTEGRHNTKPMALLERAHHWLSNGTTHEPNMYREKVRDGREKISAR